jgi:hypothetical protein
MSLNGTLNNNKRDGVCSTTHSSVGLKDPKLKRSCILLAESGRNLPQVMKRGVHVRGSLGKRENRTRGGRAHANGA